MFEITRRGRLAHSASVYGRRSEMLPERRIEALPEIFVPGSSEYSVETNASSQNRYIQSAMIRSRAVSHSIYSNDDNGPGPGKS